MDLKQKALDWKTADWKAKLSYSYMVVMLPGILGFATIKILESSLLFDPEVYDWIVFIPFFILMVVIPWWGWFYFLHGGVKNFK